MYAVRRHLLTFLVLLVMAAPRTAAAWVETLTKSHVVTVEVDRDGGARVSHEIIIKVKGGPLTAIELQGVDTDAIALPDATVAPAESGLAGATTYPLLLEKRDDGVMRVEIDHPKGVSRGTFVFKLGYRTRLIDRDLIRPVGSMVEVRWIGPRSPDGIDSARVIFKLPASPNPPRLPPPESDSLLPGSGDGSAGVFLANLKRGAERDEIEVVRPHVAKGEPVVWRVLASTKAFDAFAPPIPVPALSPRADSDDPRSRILGIVCLSGVALLFALLVLFKFRFVERASALRSARARALVPLPAALRAALAGGALAGAAAIGTRTQEPTWAGACLLVAIALATLLPSRPIPSPRRPGRWLALSDADAFDAKEPRLPGRWLDASSLPGFFVFAILLAGFAAGAVVIFPRSPYHALLLALGASCLLPIFCTGRAGELPVDAAHQPVKWLEWLAAELRIDPALRVVAWARIPIGSPDPDELRLLIMPRRPLMGLLAIELGVEYQGAVAMPFVIVRAQDDSEAHAALPRSVSWTRGRKPEERAAVLRPRLPTRALALSLVRSLASTLTDRGPVGRKREKPAIKIPQTLKPGIKLARSAGKGSSTPKAGTTASPLQPT